MYITYHEQLAKPESVISFISAKLLSQDVVEFLNERNIHQDRYYFKDNGYYVFIYLENGDRIDIQL